MPIKFNKPDPAAAALAIVEKVTKKVAKPKKKPTPMRGRPSTYNYNSLRLQWLRNNLSLTSTEHYTLANLAEDNGILLDTLSRVARSQGWQETLAEMRVEIAEQGQRQLIAATGFDETEIRKKHAKFANIAMNKAILGIMQLDPASLSPHALVLLLQLGLAEEKKAYGMVESVTGSVTFQPGELQENIQSAAQQAMDILNKRIEKDINSLGDIIDAAPSV